MSGGRQRQRSKYEQQGEQAPPPRTADPGSASRSNSSRARPSDMGSPDAEPPARMNNNMSLQVLGGHEPSGEKCSEGRGAAQQLRPLQPGAPDRGFGTYSEMVHAMEKQWASRHLPGLFES